jgi:SAM-dependent methyltransferase
LRAELRQRLAFELRPELPFIRSALRRALQGRLASEDSESKTAVVTAGSVWLARALGLASTRLLVLDFPDFTLENLALLSDEYDFVISDRALHRCDNLPDAAHETMRVLRPGGCFVHTTSCLDIATDAPVDGRRFRTAALGRLFPNASLLERGGGPTAGWIMGRKAAGAPTLDPTIETRVAKRKWYRFRSAKAKFGLTAIIRCEAPYLIQWIAHHRVLGFEQITIYDHESNDGTSRILAPLAQAGIIGAVYWKDRAARQHRAYDNALRRLRDHVEWCLFADPDEFLVLDPGLTLDDILPADPSITAVGIPWRMFGSAGQRNRGTGLVIERFTKAAPTYHRLVKSLVRLRDARKIGIHTPTQIRGRIADVLGKPLDLQVPRSAPSPARIHHYFNRSWEEFVYKRLRGDIASKETYSFSDFDRYGAGEVELPDALPLAPLVKEEMVRLRRIIGPLRDG